MDGIKRKELKGKNGSHILLSSCHWNNLTRGFLTDIVPPTQQEPISKMDSPLHETKDGRIDHKDENVKERPEWV
jgi:hypothetical protein